MISLILGSGGLIFAAGRVFGRSLRSRQNYRALSAMSERELRDIGLRGSDLQGTSANSHLADPTAIIAIRVSERRSRLAGGESLDGATRAAASEAPAQPGQIAIGLDAGRPCRPVFLRAAE